jgi:hypothetical protein
MPQARTLVRAKHSTQQSGHYDILCPHENVKRQTLRVMTTFVQDLTEGATQFNKGVAERLGIDAPKRKSVRARRAA